MSDSQENATTAALRELGIPVTSRTVVVDGLPKGSPSKGKLQKGDVIVSVDGEKVAAARRCATSSRGRKPGDEVRPWCRP